MSFKYRFILSFVLLETFFIILIVSVNFFTINTSTKNLTNEKIESNVTLLGQLVKVPVSIYDIGTLDDLVTNANTNKYINSIIVLDSHDRILSSRYTYKHLKEEDLLKIKENKSVEVDNKTYEIIYKEIFEEETLVCSLYIIFDTTSSSKSIEDNKTRTLFIIFIEIIISTLLSYILGSRLTKKLTQLSNIAIKIGKEENIEVPFTNTKDEIGILSKSMSEMQEDLKKRNYQLIHTNKKLEEQKEELIRANKAKDDFLANMSHELKTPLNSINVVSSVMKRNRDNNLNEKQIKSLEIINKCGNDLLYLVNDVLDISKLEAHEIKINYAEINIHKFITQVYDLIKPQAKEKNLNFVLDIDSTLTTIYSDENKINQIIKNLLSNSLKFTKEGTISLIVKDEDKNITISVNDEGIGIPQEKLAHIFDRFKQVDSSTSRQYGGTGLGLAISQELALLLKGTIHIQSTENVGSNFKLTIPKKNQNDIDINLTKIDEESEIERIEISEKKEEPINKYQEKESILIFNSDPMFFFNVTIKLGKKYNVFQVSNTKEFLNIYKKNSIVKTIIDFSSIKKEELEEIEIEEQKKIIAIYEDKSEDTYSQYDNNICLKINKSNINKEITNV
ncbi:sensor histidine kinase [Poseidonibacter ostreae]|uniref:histidine kinase n=1 Tax=Poseidonibacter ostreae TaxID=2654171 RepID=A0A6L4WNF6_9BACT|nr:HAMP domain-containing sensor histidine kinase [Poseidonibacter ostreae]KAB7885032.1 HAMP domain-containing protein [Poseidonibacter ostreae]KAB7889826.1 HAMP domain-containing protein [Poseidonibacter ostreae]